MIHFIYLSIIAIILIIGYVVFMLAREVFNDAEQEIKRLEKENARLINIVYNIKTDPNTCG